MTEENKQLANYDEELAKLAKKVVKTEKPSASSVTAKAGILAYNGTPCAGNKLDVIIIASTHANLFYEEKYDPNDIKSPVCYAYSEDPEEVDMVPHPKSPKPQAERCADCWANKWNSDPDGGKGKACKNSRRLALIPSGVTAEDLPTAEVATLSLPVMTVSKRWSPYVHKLATLFGLPPLAMITKLGTIPDQKSQFQITFDDVGPVDKALIPGLLAKAGTVKEILEKEYEPNAEPDPDAPEKPTKKRKF